MFAEELWPAPIPWECCYNAFPGPYAALCLGFSSCSCLVVQLWGSGCFPPPPLSADLPPPPPPQDPLLARTFSNLHHCVGPSAAHGQLSVPAADVF